MATFTIGNGKTELLRHVGHIEQLAGIRLLEAGDGRSRGSRVLDVDRRGLRFQVLADRAGTFQLFYKGASLCGVRQMVMCIRHYEAQGWVAALVSGAVCWRLAAWISLLCRRKMLMATLWDYTAVSAYLPAQLNYRTYWDGGEYARNQRRGASGCAVWRKSGLIVA